MENVIEVGKIAKEQKRKEKKARKVDIELKTHKNNRKKLWLTVAYIWLVAGILGMSVMAIEAYVDYRATHDWIWKSPVTFNRILTIEKIEPKVLQVLSPVAKEMVEPIGDLAPIEKKLMDKWGLGEFKVARAISKCESGMNSEAVNWSSRDVGVMQINWPIWKEPVKEKFGYTLKDLFDEDKNIEVAYWIWDRADGVDEDNKGSWDPWVAKRTACFLAEL